MVTLDYNTSYKFFCQGENNIFLKFRAAKYNIFTRRNPQPFFPRIVP